MPESTGVSEDHEGRVIADRLTFEMEFEGPQESFFDDGGGTIAEA